MNNVFACRLVYPGLVGWCGKEGKKNLKKLYILRVVLRGGGYDTIFYYIYIFFQWV